MIAWPSDVIAALWIGWLSYWWAIAARGTKPAKRRENVATRLAYSLPLWIAVLLLIGRLPFMSSRFAPVGLGVELAGLAVAVAGFAFAIWARVHLGGNWSGSVTVKQGHTLVQSGPYAYVRHPIYTGLLAAILGTALVLGEWRDLVALMLATASCWYKLSLEEQWMGETFGAAYADYRQRVRALVPFLL